MSLAEIHELHRQGHVCFIAEHEGEIVYLSWMQFGTASFPSIKMHLVLREDEVYLGAVFVSPAFRRRGLGRAAADERARWLRSRGIRTLYGLVLTHNVPMRRMVEGIGARQVGRAVLICWRWGRWIPLISVVTSFDRSASLGEICAPDRLRLRTGLTFYRKGPGRVYNS
jgi:GNAT superfamily N-acetyltransferase